jgi:AcrR family transcriptional regulator
MTDPIEPWLEELLKTGSDKDKMTEKQSRILQAAVEVFAEKGYAASSTSEIAQRAQVAEGTIFRHYKTKKELLLSIMTPAMVRLIAPYVLREFRDVLQTEFTSYDQLLRAMIENRIHFIRKNRRLIKIIIQEIPFQPDLQEHFKKVVFSKVLERLSQIVDRFKAEGKIADYPTLTILRLSASAVVGYILSRTLNEDRGDSDWDDEREREATISFLMKGLAP